MPPLEVTTISVYPVKSLRPIRPETWPVERRGLKHDRRWMVVDSDGVFMTRRELTEMAKVEAVPEGGGLVFSKEGFGSVCAPLQPEGPAGSGKIWRTRTTGRY